MSQRFWLANNACWDQSRWGYSQYSYVTAFHRIKTCCTAFVACSFDLHSLLCYFNYNPSNEYLKSNKKLQILHSLWAGWCKIDPTFAWIIAKHKNPRVFSKVSADLGSDVEGRPRLSPQTDLVLIVDELEADRPAFRQDLPTVPRVLFDQTDPSFARIFPPPKVWATSQTI